MIFLVVVVGLSFCCVFIMYFLFDVIIFSLLGLVDELIVMGIILIFFFFRGSIVFFIFLGWFVDFLLVIMIRIFFILGLVGFELNNCLVFFKVFFKLGFFLGCWDDFILVFKEFMLDFLLKFNFWIVFLLNMMRLKWSLLVILYLLIIVVIVFLMCLKVFEVNIVVVLIVNFRLICGICRLFERYKRIS